MTAVLVKSGASLTFVTNSVKLSDADALPLSVQTTVIAWEPMSACSGVPLIIPEAMVSVDGLPEIVYVKVSPTSTSVHIPETSRL